MAASTNPTELGWKQCFLRAASRLKPGKDVITDLEEWNDFVGQLIEKGLVPPAEHIPMSRLLGTQTPSEHSPVAFPLVRELVIQQSLQDPRVEQVDDAVSLALQKVNHATMLVSRWDENTLDHKEILALLSLGEEMNVLADRANAAAQEWNTNNAHKAEEESLYNLFWSCLSDKPASMEIDARFRLKAVDYSKKNPTRNCEEFQRNFGFEVEKQLADVRKRVVKFDTSERDSSTPKANRPYPAVPVLMSSGVKRSLATSPASDGRPDLEVEVLSIPHVLPTGSLTYWLWQCHASRQMILSQYFPDYLGYNDTMDPDNSHYFAQRKKGFGLHKLVEQCGCLEESRALFRRLRYMMATALRDILYMSSYRIEPLRLSNFVLSEGAGPDAPLELTIQRVKWGAPRSSAVVPTLQTDTVEMPHTHQMMDRELSINWVQLMLDLTVGKTRRLEDPNEPLHSLCTKNNLEPAFTAMLMCTSLSLGHPIAAGMDDIVQYPTFQHEQDHPARVLFSVRSCFQDTDQ